MPFAAAEAVIRTRKALFNIINARVRMNIYVWISTCGHATCGYATCERASTDFRPVR